MKKHVAPFAIAAFIAAAPYSQSAAAIVSTADDDPATPDIASDEIILSITGVFSESRPIDYVESFLATPLTERINIDIGIINGAGAPAGFNNLVLSFSSSAGTFVHQLTEDVASGAGMQTAFLLSIASAAGEFFTVRLTGDAFAPGSSSALLSMNFTASEVPLPAAWPLLLAGLASLSFATRRASEQKSRACS